MSTIVYIGLGLFALPLATGFAASYATHGRFGSLAPIGLTFAMLLTYGALIGYEGIWALSDWNGSVDGDNILNPLGLYNEDSRREFLRLTALIFAIPTVHSIAGIWAAALINRRGLPAA